MLAGTWRTWGKGKKLQATVIISNGIGIPLFLLFFNVLGEAAGVGREVVGGGGALRDGQQSKK
jgi:hypothetical protein